MKNITILLAVAGVIVGGGVGALVNSEMMDMYTSAAVGGVIGFLVGWALQSRTKKSEE